MTYVELNPIRANMAITSESSKFTSIKQRIDNHKLSAGLVSKKDELIAAKTKLTFKNFLEEGGHLQDQLPYHYREYLVLLDWNGRVIKADKCGAIDVQLPPILKPLGIDAEHWCKAMQPKGAHQFSRAVGRRDTLREYASKLNIRWIKGISLSAKLFPT